MQCVTMDLDLQVHLVPKEELHLDALQPLRASDQLEVDRGVQREQSLLSARLTFHALQQDRDKSFQNRKSDELHLRPYRHRLQGGMFHL